jgi:putative FmdB family regulatory protein
MPTYDYKCADCGRIFEKFHGMNEQPQIVCPECSSVNTARQVSLGAGVVFKGSGFYVNDYKKSGGDNSSSAPAAEKSGDVKSAESPAATPAKSAHSCGPGCAH